MERRRCRTTYHNRCRLIVVVFLQICCNLSIRAFHKALICCCCFFLGIIFIFMYSLVNLNMSLLPCFGSKVVWSENCLLSMVVRLLMMVRGRKPPSIFIVLYNVVMLLNFLCHLLSRCHLWVFLIFLE